MDLRPYQHRAVAETRAALQRHRSVCLTLQVGAGKTVIACEMLKLALQRSKRGLFVVHRIELVTQARERLQRFGIDPGIIKAGIPQAPGRPVQVACVPTLIRRHFPPADLVIFDECHHTPSSSWARVLQHYREAGAFIIGITATPVRLDGRGLGEAFDCIVEPVTTKELVDGGYLLDPIVYAPPIDLSEIHVRRGDYDIPELAEKMSTLCGDLVQHWQQHGAGRPTVAFAVNVAHSRLIESAFSDAGLRVRHVDGTSPWAERQAAARDLRSGAVDMITQCMIWTEGVDIPELSCLVIARPTMSLGLHRQMVGRVMRPAPGKPNAVVLDHAGNHIRHGMITDHVVWSLDARVRRKRETPSLRTCKNCYAIIPQFCTECPQCGEPCVGDPRELPPIDAPGQLVRLLGGATPPADREIEYRRLVEVASAKGYKLGWARKQYQERFGTWPRLREIEKGYRCQGHEWETRDFGPRHVRRCSRCFATVE